MEDMLMLATPVDRPMLGTVVLKRGILNEGIVKFRCFYASESLATKSWSERFLDCGLSNWSARPRESMREKEKKVSRRRALTFGDVRRTLDEAQNRHVDLDVLVLLLSDLLLARYQSLLDLFREEIWPHGVDDLHGQVNIQRVGYKGALRRKRKGMGTYVEEILSANWSSLNFSLGIRKVNARLRIPNGSVVKCITIELTQLRYADPPHI